MNGAGWPEGQSGGQELLTIVDSRHGGHPEIGVVLVVESVAVPVHGVVEVRVIPDGKRVRTTGLERE